MWTKQFFKNVLTFLRDHILLIRASTWQVEQRWQKGIEEKKPNLVAPGRGRLTLFDEPSRDWGPQAGQPASGKASKAYRRPASTLLTTFFLSLANQSSWVEDTTVLHGVRQQARPSWMSSTWLKHDIAQMRLSANATNNAGLHGP